MRGSKKNQIGANTELFAIMHRRNNTLSARWRRFYKKRLQPIDNWCEDLMEFSPVLAAVLLVGTLVMMGLIASIITTPGGIGLVAGSLAETAASAKSDLLDLLRQLL